MRWPVRRGWRPSRIGLRLLAFNLLVVFVPVVGVLYLDLYEARLLQAQEREMVQQARVLAAVLGDGPAIDAVAIERTFARLERRTDARLRVFDTRGALIADSHRLPVEARAEERGSYRADSTEPLTNTRQRALYRLGAWVANARERFASVARAWLSKLDETPQPAHAAGVPTPEVREALQGRYGAATRRTPGQRSLTLYSAVPIRHENAVTGAVVVSQSTFRILQTLYQVRLRIFEIVVASIVAAALLTTLAAMTIVRPLKRLRDQAGALTEHRGPLRAAFPGTGRRDEIGALARALEQLTRRLDDHIRLLESFAGDVSHEFRNPLASIRTAAEIIAESDSADDRKRFLEMMRRDVDRLERLVGGVREMARIDGQLEHYRLEIVDVREVLEEVIAGVRLVSPGGAPMRVTGADAPCHVRSAREQLAQAFENLLSNAASFAPEGTAIDVTVAGVAGGCRITIADRGPGIPEAHLRRVFDRFFSYRPGEERREHLGIGLAIARQIVAGYGGTITARNRIDGGAAFDVELPLVAIPRQVSAGQ